MRKARERGIRAGEVQGCVVARATLYFLLRYPGQIGDVAQEFPEDAAARPAAVARGRGSHRVRTAPQRAAIAELQGNRNPLIDHPEWARAIDFSGVWP
ncbi:hypothetical protein GCM10011428_58220 [Streptomyces violaceus]